MRGGVNLALTMARQAGAMERMIDLAREHWEALDQLARREHVSVSALLQEAVRREVQRRGRAPKAEGPDEALLSPIRAHLADDFAYAKGWAELDTRLQRKGYRLAESGPGLILVAWPGGEKICKASDLGYSHARLARKFGQPWPDHAQAWRALRQAG